MNFFQAQDHARRNTKWLLVLFILAVVSSIAIVYLCLHFGLLYGAGQPQLQAQPLVVNYDLLTNTAVGVLAVVSIGSIYKALVLSGGGSAVAESMAGRLLAHTTTNPDERQLLNIVEEMAIAAGAPVPQVYVMPDGNINAFAAGTTPHNAVIGVTQGALKQLSREQMQGVIAHEFSHIMNGDMRLNIRLIAIIHGIMLLGYLGYFILRGSLFSSMGSRRSGGGGNNMLPLIGIVLIVVGFVGTFFGSWIRAAVSRQREYLADAAAVQYTRYPEGIAGALERIGQLAGVIDTPHRDQSGSAYKKRVAIGLASQVEQGQVVDKHAIEYSHMFFSKPVALGFSNPFATHPPLDKRIKRIVPQWSADTLINTSDNIPVQQTAAPPPESAKSHSANVQRAAAGYSNLLGGNETAGFAAAAVISNIGTINMSSVKRAEASIKKIPQILLGATEDPYSARALIYALLLDKKHDDIRQQQLEHLAAHADKGVHALTVKLMLDVNMLAPPAILPLVQMTLPTLRLLSAQQYTLFSNNMAALVAADNAIELFEWCIQAVVTHVLHPHFTKKRFYTAGGNKNAAISYALSLLAKVGQERPKEAFTHAINESGLELPFDDRDFNPQELFTAMQTLSHLVPKRKEKFAIAAALCITHNGRIDTNEAALLRVYFMILDCPLPLEILPAE